MLQIKYIDRILGVVLIHATGTTAGFMESVRDKVYKNYTCIQKLYMYTKTLHVYKNSTCIQKPYIYTKTLCMYTKPYMYTKTLHVCKNPTCIQKLHMYAKTLHVYKNSVHVYKNSTCRSSVELMSYPGHRQGWFYTAGCKLQL